MDCHQCFVVNAIIESIQDVYWNDQLHENHNGDDENDQAFDALSSVVHLNTMGFVACFP